jgi:peptide/nickel transport system permease protein
MLMRLVEIVLCIPGLYLLIALGAVLPVDMPSTLRYFVIICILAFVGWAGIARVIRGVVLALRKQEFVNGALALGAGSWWIIRRHILPNTMSYMVVHITLLIPGYILSEASLSFLGLGIQEPEASWGNMLSSALNILTMSRHPWILAPGAAICLTVLCWSIVGDTVRDGLDPRAGVRGMQRQRRRVL